MIAFLVVPNDALKQVGYITQVRTGIGQVGYDLVFMRMADESLIVRENQGFWQVPNEQEILSLRMNALLH